MEIYGAIWRLHRHAMPVSKFIRMMQNKGEIMQRIIFATTNENKMKEIREILSDFPVEIFSLQEAGIKADIDENGSSFEEN